MHETDFELVPQCDPDRREFWVARVEQALGLVPLADFAAGCIGATRLSWGGGDTPNQIISCAWHPRGLRVEFVEGYAQYTGEGEVRGRWQSVLPTGVLPRCLRNWRRVVTALDAAPSCEYERMTLDGFCCHHALWTEGRHELVSWSGLEEGTHHRQRELINAYNWVRVAGWCRSKVPFL